MINRLSIIGVGLIGGSLARALRDARLVGEIVGFGRSLGNLQEAVELGVIDRAATSVADAVHDADMVVLALPVGGMAEVLADVAPRLAGTTIVTDVGSVKASVTAAARGALGANFPRFVPGHPIAGTEQSGVASSIVDLFVHRRVILTPEPETDAAAVEAVRAMWAATGADVSFMSALEHDRILAASSHLPHLLAYALVDMLVRRDDHRAIFDCAGTGFRDATRIAASDPVMWRDICLSNRDAVLEVLNQYRSDLGDMIRAIECGDARWLMDGFCRAKHARDAFSKKFVNGED
jgi:prephenate dehydrogenase